MKAMKKSIKKATSKKSSPKVKIYTTSTCPWCQRAKEFFKANKIPYQEISVENNAEAQKEMIKKSGQLGVPVIDIDGKIIIGFNEMALRKALSL